MHKTRKATQIGDEKAKVVQLGAKAIQELLLAKAKSADLSYAIPEAKWDTLPKVEQEAIAAKRSRCTIIEKTLSDL